MTIETTRAVADLIYDEIKSKAPETVTAADVAATVEAQRPGVGYTTISATLSQLLSDRNRPGVIRVSTGVYAYRPGEPATKPASPPRKTSAVSAKVLGQLQKMGTAKAIEIHAAMPEFTTKQISQSLLHLSKSVPEVTRPELGVYQYSNGHHPTPVRPETSGELAPILDAVPDKAFEAVGLKVMARAFDGDRLCVDENGYAWKVTLSVEAHLV